MLIAVFITEIVILLKYVTYVMIIAPAGISPRGEIPRRHPSNSRVYYGQYLQFKYTVSILEKISICSNWGREESVGNDDVSIVCARKYEMVRMTKRQKIPKGPLR